MSPGLIRSALGVEVPGQLRNLEEPPPTWTTLQIPAVTTKLKSVLLIVFHLGNLVETFIFVCIYSALYFLQHEMNKAVSD